MFKFFTQKQWFLWSILGSIFILVSTWYQVQLDVKINECVKPSLAPGYLLESFVNHYRNFILHTVGMIRMFVDV